MLDDTMRVVLGKLADADGASFVDLVAIAGLNPSLAFRGADLRDVDFGECSLAGYDFTGADLSGARLDRASLEGACFVDVIDIGTRWPSRARRKMPPSKLSGLSPLHDHAVALMMRSLSQDGRAVALMPTGTGRGRVLEEVIATLAGMGELRRAVLFVESVAERDQFVARLRDRLGYDRVQTVKEAINNGLRSDLLVHNVTLYNLGLDRLAEALKPYGQVKTLFASSIDRLPQLLKTGGKLLDEARIAAVGNALLDADRPDRRRTWARVERLFGSPSFVLELEQAVREGILEPARIVVPGEFMPPRAFQAGGPETPSGDLTHVLAPLASGLIREVRKRRPRSLAVVCRDNSQADAMTYLLSRRERMLGRIMRTGIRWPTERTIHELPGHPNVFVGVATRTMTPFCWQVECMAVVTPLSVTRAQSLAYRPGSSEVGPPPLILDFADAFSGFHYREYGESGRSVDGLGGKAEGPLWSCETNERHWPD
jgi:hypothetical protein